MKTQNATLEGFVTPIHWNNLNEPVGFSLYTEEGEDIVIKTRKGLKMLKNLIMQKIKIVGTLVNAKDEDDEKEIVDIKQIIFTRMNYGTTKSAY